MKEEGQRCCSGLKPGRVIVFCLAPIVGQSGSAQALNRIQGSWENAAN